jgi:spore maturation protein CgeB
VNTVIFCHSILSDWNHGNAHFLRGIVSELLSRGHSVKVFEPEDAWSAKNLVADAGESALWASRAVYPAFELCRYRLEALDLDAALDSAALVIVHEWSPTELVRQVGAHRVKGGRYRLLFHDTHHRMVTAPEEMRAYDFSGYDGVLAFGEVLRQRYLKAGWGDRAFVWHEAADTRVFRPRPDIERTRDLVWIGNWGDDERSRELSEFLLEPSHELGLSTRVHGVRYPEAARTALAHAQVEYRGWLPNYRVPEVFAEHRVTVHVPRRPYTEALPGIPTIRPFEALACGIPLVSAPWNDVEGLFRAGRDFLMARNKQEMKRMLRAVLAEPDFAQALADSGRERVLARHTCAQRVDELLQICAQLSGQATRAAAPELGWSEMAAHLDSAAVSAARST